MKEKLENDEGCPNFQVPLYMHVLIFNWITCLVSATFEGNTMKVGNFLFWNIEAENCSANIVPVTLLLHSAQIGRMSRGRGETGAVAGRTRSV